MAEAAFGTFRPSLGASSNPGTPKKKKKQELVSHRLLVLQGVKITSSRRCVHSAARKQ